ncbi:REP-associated tyrosine transposase [Pelagicoccus mobilis]|uniref:Transposase n=1 Tax=Pelagicoccus mobilis TaxID=415221 RepID=A0A934S4N8_9BACT|nr:transposase [Pelagicoccus mobilis]MBK1880666.1 transposase [Pelagicoccus mobilis]
MKRPPHSKDLRKGRHSEPNARYFVTFKAKPPSSSLCEPETHRAFKLTIEELERDNVFEMIAHVLMPDHVHILFRLGEILDLGKSISRLKFQFRKTSEPAKTYWQSGYYDHKLRNDSELHPILHYIYMNPYRAKLTEINTTWPYLYFRAKEWQWFEPLLDKDCPYPEWLDR